MAENRQSRMQRRKTKKAKKTKQSKFSWKKIIITIGIIGLLFFISFAGLFIYYASGAPDINAAKLSDPLSSKIYDRNGVLIADLGAQKRTKIEYDDIPKVLEDAVIATEDSRFREHMGVDVFRMVAAVWANITDGFGSQGASTITQQVVKNAFLSTDKKLKRKIQEQWMAIQLEREYSKDEILTMYLNKIHYGNSTYGVAKAAEVYFGKKDLSKLTLPEAALLAGIPQLPNVYDPFKNPDKAEERKDLVLDLMVQHGKITEEEANTAKEVTVEEMVVDNYENNIEYADFLEKVMEEVKAELGEDIDIYQDGLEIYTTLDVKAQEHVEFLLSDHQDNPFKNYFVDDKMQTALTVIDTKTGEILAIGGGRNGKQGIGADYNYAFQDGFQPGSTMKPLVDYGPLIEYFKKPTYYQIKDEKYAYSWGKEIRNWDGKYTGWRSMRYHLAWSRNVPALKVLQEVGTDKAEEFISNLGIPIPEDGVTETDAIGGHIEPTTVQMAGAYAAFGNEGVFNKPHAVRKVVIGKKTIDFTPEPEVAMSDYTAFMISDMLKDVVSYGTGSDAKISGMPIAGKTGTTNEDRDAWFNGYTTNYSIAIWTGYPKSSDTLPWEGKQLPELMFKNIMQYISKDKETSDFVQPNSVVKIAVEKGSNPAKLPSEFTPKDEIVYEWFVKGYEPKETSEKYNKINPVQNLTAEYKEKEKAVDLKWDYPKLDKDQKVQFEIRAGVQNSDMAVVTTTENKKVRVTNIHPGQTYTFAIVAINTDNPENQSDPVLVTIEIPEEDDDLLDDFFDNDDGEGNGDGNGEGNGGTDSTGDGTNNDDGSNDGSNDGTDGTQDGETGNNEDLEDIFSNLN